ncbi:substrate-binding domain-containing protein [Actinophytocola sediminis]
MSAAAERRRIGGLLAAAAVLASCTSAPPTEPLTVLADSTIAAIEPLLSDLRAETGLALRVDYLPTLAASRVLTEPNDYDLAWLATDRYLRLDPRRGDPPRTATMTTAVAVGLRPGVADRLGTDPTWADLADAAAAGTVTFAMADPRVAESAVGALVGVATAATGTGSALREQDITCDHLRGFRHGHRVMAETDLETAARFTRAGSDVDGLVGYESDLAALNASDRLAEPLEIVRPADGAVQSDYPLLLLDLNRQGDYRRLADWVRTESTQRRLVATTWRRPVIAGVPRPPGLPASTGGELYFPDTAAVVRTLVDGYADARAQPAAHTVFVLDFSGSMRGAPMAALRTAFDRLTDWRSHAGERVTVLRFGAAVAREPTVTITGPGDRDRLRAAVATESYAARTAVWAALDRAYDVVAEFPAGTPATIVLVTDGHSNAGRSLADHLREPRPAAVSLLVLTTGAVDDAALTRAVTATGGRLLAATSTELERTLEDLRGCV